MKFEDFDLYRSVHDIYLVFEKENRKPRSSDWFIYKAKRKVLTNLVTEKLASNSCNLYGQEEILKAWDDFGKNKEKYKLIIATADFTKSNLCQFGKFGGCSPTVSIEKVDNKLGWTPKNCLIVCPKHGANLYSVSGSQGGLVKV